MWIALCVALASALQLEMTPEQRFETSELVVHAEVTSAEVNWEPGVVGGIATTVWLAPLDALRGEAPETLEVVLPGGSIDGFTSVVDDAATLVEDRRYLLFLVPSGDGRWQVLGGRQGATRVETPGLSPGPTLDDVLERQGLLEVAR